jgi:hypothetical protein
MVANPQDLDDDDYPDMMEVGSKSTLSYKDIVLQQYRQITLLSNVEFRGGFYNTSINSRGEEKTIYIPDSREVYSNAVFGLAQLLIPKFDAKMQEAWQEYEEMRDANKKWFIDISTPKEEVILGERFYEETKDKINLETYKTRMLEIHQYLYTQLSLLLSRQNYLEFGGGTYR